MRTDLYWIDGPWAGKLAISPRPRGGDWLADEVQAWQRAGVQTVVSLLTADEAAELGLNEEAAEAAARGIEFVSFPVTDRGVPSSSHEYRRLLFALAKQLADGRTVVVHCRQGIGRAALIAIGLYLHPASEQEAAIARSNGPQPPGAGHRQRRWIESAKAP